MLLTPRDPQQLASFMRDFKRNVAFEIGRLHGWQGAFWHGRYTAIPVSDEEQAQVARLEYLLSQGCKEDLVASPYDWPGVHCARALGRGEALSGHWFDRTAHRRKSPNPHRPANPEDHTALLTVLFAPLPCWAHLPGSTYRQRVREIIRRIEEQTAERHARHNTRPLGIDAVCKAHPHQRPETLERRPAPKIHAATSEARSQWLEAHQLFVTAYREASQKLRSGATQVAFPPGSFPPALPYVPS